MAAFELNDTARGFQSPESLGFGDGGCGCGENNNTGKIKQENIIAFKLYDVCRQQDCLTSCEIGPARAAEAVIIGDNTINEGDIIIPPSEAASVTVDNLRIKRIMIVSKTPNAFRRGFWDIELKYVFEYRLTFREADGCIIGCIRANSIYNRKVTLFGSESSDLVIGTDLFCDCGMIEAAPYILCEAKAVALSATLRYECNCSCNCCDPCGGTGITELGAPVAVDVTIGLFSIVKLFRIVDLSVESRGFTIPSECEEVSPMNPCEYFDTLDFPMDLFAPPQKPEFMAGISSNIPAAGRNIEDTGCGCSE